MQQSSAAEKFPERLNDTTGVHKTLRPAVLPSFRARRTPQF